MIQPGDFDLPPMIRGSNYEYGFIVQNDSVAKDLTGCTVQVKLSNTDGIIATLTTSNCLTVYAAAGMISISIDDSIISTYPLGEMIYSLNITETTGEIYRYIEGRILVRE